MLFLRINDSVEWCQPFLLDSQTHPIRYEEGRIFLYDMMMKDFDAIVASVVIIFIYNIYIINPKILTSSYHL